MHGLKHYRIFQHIMQILISIFTCVTDLFILDKVLTWKFSKEIIENNAKILKISSGGAQFSRRVFRDESVCSTSRSVVSLRHFKNRLKCGCSARASLPAAATTPATASLGPDIALPSEHKKKQTKKISYIVRSAGTMRRQKLFRKFNEL